MDQLSVDSVSIGAGQRDERALLLIDRSAVGGNGKGGDFSSGTYDSGILHVLHMYRCCRTLQISTVERASARAERRNGMGCVLMDRAAACEGEVSSGMDDSFGANRGEGRDFL